MPPHPRSALADLPHEAVAALADVERFIERGTREFRLANVALFAAGFTTSRGAKAQASSLYLFAYHTGSSLWGWCGGGLAWMHDGLSGVVALCSGLLACAFTVSLLLARQAAQVSHLRSASG